MDGCYIPAKEIAQGLTPCAMRFVSFPLWEGIRSDAALKGNCYLTTLQSNLSAYAMLLGLPRYAVGYVDHFNGHSPRLSRLGWYRVCGSMPKRSCTTMQGVVTSLSANTGNLDNGQG